MIQFAVFGTPAPKGSRTVGTRRDGSPFTRPAAKGEAAWMATVAQEAMIARSRARELPEPPYRVELVFGMPKPARPSYPWPTRGDVDKLGRCAVDGLVVGGLLSEDSHVVKLGLSKRWAEPGHEGVEVLVLGGESA